METYYMKKKIIQLASIPCANSGYELSKLLNTYSNKYSSRYILGKEYFKKSSNIPFRQFPKDLFFLTQLPECIEVLKEADIIHIHHNWEMDTIKEYIKNKPIIWTLYNLVNSISYSNSIQNQDYYKKIKKYSTLITVSNQPLQKVVFTDLTTIAVPLINALWNYPKSPKSDKVYVVFAPTNRERRGIGKKMYCEVLDIIRKLKRKLDFTFDLIEGVPYENNLDRKSYAHIIIDDVDPDYEKFHNTSIEACFFGAVPLTNYFTDEFPFYKTNIYTLEQNLTNLITNRKLLNQYSLIMTHWINNVYTPQNLLKQYEKIYDKI